MLNEYEALCRRPNLYYDGVADRDIIQWKNHSPHAIASLHVLYENVQEPAQGLQDVVLANCGPPREIVRADELFATKARTVWVVLVAMTQALIGPGCPVYVHCFLSGVWQKTADSSVVKTLSGIATEPWITLAKKS